MKKIASVLVIVGLLFSCKDDTPKDYATLSGKIKNTSVKELVVKSRSGYSKSIKLNDNGSFSDTLHLSNKGELFIFSAGGTAQIFLKNNDDIKILLDAKDFKKSLSFSGQGAKTSTYLAAKNLLQSNVAINELFDLNEADFKKKSTEIAKKFTSLMNDYKDIDSSFYTEEKAALSTLPAMLSEQYAKMKAEKNKFVTLEGKPSPNFKNYENYKGGATSLKDLRGKYVYIDVWATWCRPCLGEIPHLQKLEEEFKGKNIQFVSISVDRETAKATWKKMIADKKMGGIQLFAKKGDSFAKEYKINSIPRFILLDPKGNVVYANAPRPSSSKIKDILTNLLK